MRFDEHIRAFLDDSVDEDEARALAAAAVAANVRQLKLSIAERLWQARQLAGAGGGPASAGQLDAARGLKALYDAALAELARLSTHTSPTRTGDEPDAAGGGTGGPAEAGVPGRAPFSGLPGAQ